MRLTPHRLRLLVLLGIAAAAQALLFAPLPAWAHVLLFLLWAGCIPGHLLAEVVGGDFGAPPTRLEWLLYAVGAGYVVILLTLLLLSYLPGPLLPWHLHVAVDGLLLLLAVAAWRRAGQTPPAPLPLPRWEIATLALILTAAAILRLPGLGYHDFHGDEARAVLRAAAVVQGYDDVLFLHKKGPAEILLPTAVFLVTGHVTEATSRLPFALAGLTALAAVYWLGKRLFAHMRGALGSIAGLTAAALLAVDGFFVGFSRIVQYQSLVILMSALAVLVMARLWQSPRAPARGLLLVAFFLAGGLWAHYEAGLVALPLLILVVELWRRHPAQRRELSLAVIAAAAVGAVLLALFYLPFVTHSQFQATATYLFDRRIGGDGLPTNNLGDFFTRLTTYSSVYYAATLAVGTLALLAATYRRVLGPRVGLAAGAAVVALAAVTAWQPEWARVGGRDWMVLFFAAALLPIWLRPGLRVQERLLWMWWGVGLLFMLFFTAKPRTHVYVFFTPWALLLGLGASMWVTGLLRRYAWRRVATGGALAAALLLLLWGGYTYQLFAVNRVEVLRTWEENWPTGYLRPFDRLDNRALFGFPLAYGWKAVGELYRQGVIHGDYTTNEVEFWAPIWYTHGRMRCDNQAEWVFAIDPPQPDPVGYRTALARQLSDRGFAPWGAITLRGEPRLTLYGRAAPDASPRTFALEEYAASFDAHATPDLPLGYPVVTPPIPHPIGANFGPNSGDNPGGLIRLEGYDLAAPAQIAPGDTLTLTLYWRSLAPIEASYKVFNQSFYGDGVMVAQQDGYPVCGSRPTWRWDPGELIADVHFLTIRADAPDGLYPLFTGLYLEESLSRLRVLDGAGNPIDDRVQLTAIRVGPE